MIALTREIGMQQDSGNSRVTLGLCQSDGYQPAGQVHCCLRIGGVDVPVSVPRAALTNHHLLGGAAEIVLRIPGQQPARLEVESLLTPSQQRMANAWIAEMEDYDRF